MFYDDANHGHLLETHNQSRQIMRLLSCELLNALCIDTSTPLVRHVGCLVMESMPELQVRVELTIETDHNSRNNTLRPKRKLFAVNSKIAGALIWPWVID